MPYISWEGESSHTAESLLTPQRGKGRSEIGRAAVFLASMLAGGRMLFNDIESKAREQGISISTLHRAKKQLGIESDREGFGARGKFYWKLPSQPS